MEEANRSAMDTKDRLRHPYPNNSVCVRLSASLFAGRISNVLSGSCVPRDLVG